MQKPKITKLPNGIRVLLIPEQKQRTATVLVLVETGSKYETKKENGLSHFLEHMCFKGTTNRPTSLGISSELDGIGAEYNAFTDREYTGYYAKVASKYLLRAVDIVGDIYVNPILEASEIEKEKGVIMGEIDMRNDMLQSRVHELFMELMYGDQPAGWPVAGPKETILRFSRRDFLAYRKAHYVASSTIVVVSGGFDPKKTLKEVKKIFGKVENTPKKKKQKIKFVPGGPKVLHHKKTSDQTHIVIGTEGIPTNHKDTHAMRVLAMVLGGGMSSRLFKRMRDELGIGYYAYASHEALTDHGVFTVSAGVDNKRVEEGVKAMVSELVRLREHGVSKEELKKVKEMIAGRFALGLESSDEVAEFFGFQEVLKKEIKTPEEVLHAINAVSEEDITRLAHRLFVSGRLRIAIVGPQQSMKTLEKLIALS